MRMVEFLRRTKGTVRGPVAYIRVVVLLLLVFGVSSPASILSDFGIIAMVLFVAWTGASLLNPPLANLIERLCVYVLAAFSVYLIGTSEGFLGQCVACQNWIYATLAAALAVAVRFSGGGFRTNSLDFLVILVAITLPNTSFLAGYPELGILAVRLIILFYACELLLSHLPRRWDVLRVVGLGALLTMGVRAFVS